MKHVKVFDQVVMRAEFANGGCVVHKITGDYEGVCSAWYDEHGRLLDAEQRTRPFAPPRNVKRDGPMWDHLEAFGRIIPKPSKGAA